MSGAPLFDSHCHLDPDVFGDDAGVDAAVARARVAGVTRMVTIGAGYGTAGIARAIAVAERNPEVWAAVGVHPHDADAWTDQTEGALREAAQHPRVVALGEMGLDFHYDQSPRDIQRAVLRRQLRLALELGMPVVIHDRESDGETLRILLEEDAFSGAGVLYHCFTGTVADQARIVAAGGYISIPGIVTFKNAGIMREVAQQTPLDRLLVETDTPYLTPMPFRGTRNEPARVGLVAACVAGVRGATTEEIAAATWNNASRYYRLPAD